MAEALMKARSPNSDYWVRIKNDTAGVDVICDCPDHDSIMTASHFMPRSLALSGLSIAGIGGATAATIAGGDLISQDSTKLIWSGTDSIRLPLQLIFDAETNSYQDVHRVCALLQSLTLPTKSAMGRMLMPPNPVRNLLDPYNNISGTDNRTVLWIGRRWYFDNVVVESANYVSPTRLNKGYPIAGAIDLSLVTDYVLSRDEYLHAAGVSN